MSGQVQVNQTAFVGTLVSPIKRTAQSLATSEAPTRAPRTATSSTRPLRARSLEVSERSRLFLAGSRRWVTSPAAQLRPSSFRVTMSAASLAPGPLPEPLRARDGGFTQESVFVRLPAILERLLKENPQYSAEVVSHIRQIEAEILGTAGEGVRFVRADGGPDLEEWREWVEPHEGRPWSEVPWFFAETYMYRRILEATGYYRKGAPLQGRDPFEPHKRQALLADLPAIRQAARATVELMQQAEAGGGPQQAAFLALLETALWGNRVDLSVRPEGGQRGCAGALVEARPDLMIVDDSPQVWEHVRGLRGARIDFVIDNAGFELATDMLLAAYLLASGIAASVVFHTKASPLFVSDALSATSCPPSPAPAPRPRRRRGARRGGAVRGRRGTLDRLASDEEPSVRALAARIREASEIDGGGLVLREDRFWCSPLPMWEMPEGVRGELGRAALVLVKGDANYRRLGGDRHWPHETPLQAVVAPYAPAPLAALRTNKSGTICAGPAARDRIAAAKAAAGDKWLTDGTYGLIQFVDVRPAAR
eukprot:tig00000880_g5167.t1